MGASDKLLHLGLTLNRKPVSLDEAVQEASRLAWRQKEDDAERICRAVLGLDPDHGEALQLLGALHVRRQSYAEGLALLRRAAEKDPGNAVLHSNIGVCLKRTGDLAGAEAAYRRALQLDPSFIDALGNLANLFKDAGRLNEAETGYRRLVELLPDNADAWNSLGFVLFGLSRWPQAVDAYRRLTRLKPQDATAWFNLATACKKSEDYAAAGEAYRQAARHDPNLLAAWLGLAALLSDQDGHPVDQNRHEEILLAFENALRLRPQDAATWLNYGIALKASGRSAEASAAYRRATAVDPGLAVAWVNLGTQLFDEGDADGAIAAFERALLAKPDYADVKFNLGIMNLLKGNYERGWPAYEWRLHPEASVAHKFDGPRHGKPMWQGEPLAGRTVLFWPEQGFGDQIQFCRYARHVRQAGGRVLLGAKPELKTLMDTLPWADEVEADGSRLHGGRYDYWAFPMSLPARFGTTLSTVPAEVPYLFADPLRVAAWRERLAPYAGRRKIGLVWAGRPTHQNDRNRSLSLVDLAPLAEVPNCVFFSLQMGEKAAEAGNPPAGMTLVHLGDQIREFADSAALLMELDLLITVDSSPAHLAGAIGRPAWVMLPANPDFRWMQERSDSPWYPSLRLFRQKRLGEWGEVVAALRDALLATGDSPCPANFAAPSALPRQAGALPAPAHEPQAQSSPLPPALPHAHNASFAPLAGRGAGGEGLPTRLGIGWQLSELHGWGIFGINVARNLLQEGRVRPRLLDLPVLEGESVAEIAALAAECEALKRQAAGMAAGQRLELPDTVVINAFGNHFSGPGCYRRVCGGRNAGFIFFEDNVFTEAELAIGRSMDVLLAGSRWNTELLKTWGFPQARYVMQGVDTDRFKPRPRQNRFGERFVVFSGGKLEYRKGQDLVLLAFREFHRRHPDALLVTAWHNPWPKVAEGMAENPYGLGWPGLDAQGQLNVAGWLLRHGLPQGAFVDIGLVNNRQMPAIFSEVDVALFPNRAEGGTNLVAMEAMASGLPCILSANTGHLDLVTDGNCYALRQQAFHTRADRAGWGESDVDEIVAALEQAYADRPGAGKVGMNSACFMQRFSWSCQTRQLIETLRDAGCLY